MFTNTKIWKLEEYTFVLMKVFRLQLQLKIKPKLITDSDDFNEL